MEDFKFEIESKLNRLFGFVEMGEVDSAEILLAEIHADLRDFIEASPAESVDPFADRGKLLGGLLAEEELDFDDASDYYQRQAYGE